MSQPKLNSRKSYKAKVEKAVELTPTQLQKLVDELQANPAVLNSWDNDTVTQVNTYIQEKRMECMPKTASDIMIPVAVQNIHERFEHSLAMIAAAGFLSRKASEFEIPDAMRSWVPERAANAKSLARTEDLHGEISALNHLYREADKCLEVQDTLQKQAQGINMKIELAANEEERNDLIKQLDEAITKLKKADRDAYDEVFKLMLFLREMAQKAETTIFDLVKRTNSIPHIGSRYNYLLDRIRLNGSSVTMPEEKARSIINRFLDSVFEYNADMHIREARGAVISADAIKYVEINGLEGAFPAHTKDSQRLPIEAYLQKVTVADEDEGIWSMFKSNPAAISALCLIINSDYIRGLFESLDRDKLIAELGKGSALEDVAYTMRTLSEIIYTPALYSATLAIVNSQDACQRFQRYLITHANAQTLWADLRRTMPADTLVQFATYCELYGEQLKTYTQSVTGLRSDIPFGVWFDATNQYHESDPKARESFVRDAGAKYLGLGSSLALLRSGVWNVAKTGDRATRKVTSFVGPGNTVLDTMFKRLEDDATLVKELMKQRVKKGQTKNRDSIRSKDEEESLKEYSSSFGAAGVDSLTPIMTAEDRRIIERAQGDERAITLLSKLSRLNKETANATDAVSLERIKVLNRLVEYTTPVDMDDITDIIKSESEYLQPKSGMTDADIQCRIAVFTEVYESIQAWASRISDADKDFHTQLKITQGKITMLQPMVTLPKIPLSQRAEVLSTLDEIHQEMNSLTITDGNVGMQVQIVNAKTGEVKTGMMHLPATME